MHQARSTLHGSGLRATGLRSERRNGLRNGLLVGLLAGLGIGCERASPQPTQPPQPRGPTCEADQCNALGMAAVARARHAEAIELLDRACTLGHAVGCSNLAGLMRGGAGGLGQPSRAVGLYDRSCALGFAEACSAVGSIYAEGKLVPPDLTRARAMYDQACARRDAYGCFTAGMFASEGRGGVRSPEAAGERFDQACALGHATACFNAGVLLYRERGARPGENERATGYFKRACDGQQPAGCLRLGIAALHGHGLVADPQAARDLFDRACAGGEADGCAAAQQLAGDRGGKGRKAPAIALTSSAATMAMHGLRVHQLECRMPEVGPMALAEAVEAVAAHKAALDACAPAGAAPAVAWTWKGRRAAQVQVRGGGPRVEACVRKAIERARAELSGECAAFVLVGDPEGAQRMLMEQRSAAISSPAMAARAAPTGQPSGQPSGPRSSAAD